MKIISGTVVSTKMKDTIIVEVARKVAHPLYKKLLKRSSRFHVHAKDHKVSMGDRVKIVETKPISKTVHFKLWETKKGMEKE